MTETAPSDGPPLLAGSATVDITPDWPVMLGGFGQRTEPSVAVHDPVQASALFLAHGNERVLIVAADLIAMPGPVAAEVARSVGESTGLTPAQICLAASHTHSAPVPADPAGTATGIAAYTPFLIDRLVACAVSAVDTARPASLRTGTATVGFLHNRCTRGVAGTTDDRVVVAVVDDASTSRPVSVLFGVGCHPVTLGWDSNVISADFPGLARRLVIERLGLRDAVFVNGTEGDVIPGTSPDRDSLDPRGYAGGTWDDTITIATQLADAVIGAVGAARPVVIGHDRPVGIARTELRADANTGGIAPGDVEPMRAEAEATLRAFIGDRFDSVPPAQMWAAASKVVVERELTEDDMRTLMIACCRYLGLTARAARQGTSPPVTVPVQVIRIGGLALLAVPGEPLTEVGTAWRERVGASDGFVVGLANGHLRYLPRAASFDRPDAAMRYETVTAGLAPDGVERILDAGTELLGAMA